MDATDPQAVSLDSTNCDAPRQGARKRRHYQRPRPRHLRAGYRRWIERQTRPSGPTAEEIAAMRAGGWEPRCNSTGEVIAWSGTGLTLMAEAAGERGEDVTYASQNGDIAVSSRDAARAARIKRSIMTRSLRATLPADTPRVARPRESHARPHTRARRAAHRGTTRAGPDDDDSEGEPAGPHACRRTNAGGKP